MVHHVTARQAFCRRELEGSGKMDVGVHGPYRVLLAENHHWRWNLHHLHRRLASSRCQGSLQATVVRERTQTCVGREPVNPTTGARKNDQGAVWLVARASCNSSVKEQADHAMSVERVLAPRAPTTAVWRARDVCHEPHQPWCHCVMGRGLGRRLIDSVAVTTDSECLLKSAQVWST